MVLFQHIPRVLSLFSCAENSPLQISRNQRTMPVKQAWPTLKTCHWQVFLTLRSADADQGPCPWTPLSFLREEKEAKKSLTALRGLNSGYVRISRTAAPTVLPDTPDNTSRSAPGSVSPR